MWVEFKRSGADTTDHSWLTGLWRSAGFLLEATPLDRMSSEILLGM